MTRKYWFIIITICGCFLVALLFMRGENELLGESNATEIPLEGVSIVVSATRRKVEYAIESKAMDYIVYDGYNKSMQLEMLKDGEWYIVGNGKISYDEPAPISPTAKHTVKYSWKDIYAHNMKAGRYRFVYTFWAMPCGEDGLRHQTDNYVVIQEFTID